MEVAHSSKTLYVNGSSACLISCNIININWVIMKLSFTYFFFTVKYILVFVSSQIIKVGLTKFKIKEDFDAHSVQKIILYIWLVSLTKVSVSKSCFYNDRVSHPEADKTLTDERFSYQYYYSRFYQPKNNPAKKIFFLYIIGRKRGPAKTIFRQKSGPVMAGPAVPPTTALWPSYIH